MYKEDILAVDGGGTKTLLLRVRPDATIAALDKAGPSNPYGNSDWRSVLTQLLKERCEGVRCVAMGLAGFSESEIFQGQLTALLAEICPAPHVVLNDVDLACRGAFLNQPGILLLSGTGSMAWGRGYQGEACRIGGWGSLFGDEGSAYWIGRSALTYFSRVLDGRINDDGVFQSGLASKRGWPQEKNAASHALLDWFSTLTDPKAEIARIAVDVDNLADEGSSHAEAILCKAADLLSQHITTARASLKAPELPWSYAGGTMKCRVLRQALIARCDLPQEAALPPIGGAILVAAGMAGWDTDSNFTTRLRGSLSSAGLL